MEEEWQCEDCGEEQTGTPAHTERDHGYHGTVTLYFCESCVDRPYF